MPAPYSKKGLIIQNKYGTTNMYRRPPFQSRAPAVRYLSASPSRPRLDPRMSLCSFPSVFFPPPTHALHAHLAHCVPSLPDDLPLPRRHTCSTHGLTHFLPSLPSLSSFPPHPSLPPFLSHFLQRMDFLAALFSKVDIKNGRQIQVIFLSPIFLRADTVLYEYVTW